MDYKGILTRAENIKKDRDIPGNMNEIDVLNPLYDHQNEYISYPVKVAGGSFAGCGCISLRTANDFADYFGGGVHVQIAAHVLQNTKTFSLHINIFPGHI